MSSIAFRDQGIQPNEVDLSSLSPISSQQNGSMTPEMERSLERLADLVVQRLQQRVPANPEFNPTIELKPNIIINNGQDTSPNDSSKKPETPYNQLKKWFTSFPTNAVGPLLLSTGTTTVEFSFRILPILSRLGVFDHPEVQKHLPLASLLGKVGNAMGKVETSIALLTFIAASPRIAGYLSTYTPYANKRDSIVKHTHNISAHINPYGVAQIAQQVSLGFEKTSNPNAQIAFLLAKLAYAKKVEKFSNESLKVLSLLEILKFVNTLK